MNTRNTLERQLKFVERNLWVHEGVPDGISLPPIADDNVAFSLDAYIVWRDELPKIQMKTKKCQEAYSLMESIVEEAESRFRIGLC